MPRATAVMFAACLALFVAVPPAQACNSVCGTGPDGCTECTFSLFCNNCWCIRFGCNDCDVWTCTASVEPDESPTLEALLTDPEPGSPGTCRQAELAAESPDIDFQDEEPKDRIGARELEPRT